jgi:tRNA pseudouridine32 synthase/23S rRNA pseudouridine746 synthase/23S rRNA pseudouridine1911/1915/1917 synthase
MKMPRKHRPRGLEIIYEDRDLLVINKEPGLLTMSFHRDELQTAECVLTDYLRKGASRSRLRAYVVHRLDRETSGLLIFAKTEAVQRHLKDHWKEVEKEYLAVVHGFLAEKSGTLSSYLAENDDQFVYSTDQTKGKWSETQYNVTRENKNFSELKINLLTGRKNQIRVHFAELGHPVVGDIKYGPKGKKFERMALHSRSIAFNHPHNGKRMIFEAPIPEFFTRLMERSIA